MHLPRNPMYPNSSQYDMYPNSSQYDAQVACDFIRPNARQVEMIAEQQKLSKIVVQASLKDIKDKLEDMCKQMAMIHELLKNHVWKASFKSTKKSQKPKKVVKRKKR